MKTSFKGLVLSLIMVIGAEALAVDAIKLGLPGYGGTGCPQGSVSATLSPDQSTLSILFDSYMVEAGNTTGKKIDYKTCNVRVPMTIPGGWSVSLIQADYRGFNYLPSGSRAIFSTEYFFAGAQGPHLDKTFSGPLNDMYLIEHNLIATALVWSGCGAKTNLSINSSMRVIANSKMDQALSTVDSADLDAGLLYHIKWAKCH
jgi:hypothetical protein